MSPWAVLFGCLALFCLHGCGNKCDDTPQAALDGKPEFGNESDGSGCRNRVDRLDALTETGCAGQGAYDKLFPDVSAAVQDMCCAFFVLKAKQDKEAVDAKLGESKGVDPPSDCKAYQAARDAIVADELIKKCTDASKEAAAIQPLLEELCSYEPSECTANGYTCPAPAPPPLMKAVEV